MKQTAVEWLSEQIYDQCRFGGTFNDVVHITQFNLDELIKQAKQMEKEQIINAFGEKRQFIGFSDNNTFGITEKTGQEYYNETYGKDNG